MSAMEFVELHFENLLVFCSLDSQFYLFVRFLMPFLLWIC